MSWSGLTRLLRGRKQEHAEPAIASPAPSANTARSREMWRLWFESKTLKASALLLPSEEQRADRLRDAQRLLEDAQAMSEEDERSRETEERIKQRPGSYYDPKDGPL